MLPRFLLVTCMLFCAIFISGWGCRSTKEAMPEGEGKTAVEKNQKQEILLIKVLDKETVILNNENVPISMLGGKLLQSKLPENQEIHIALTPDQPFGIAQQVLQECVNVGFLRTKIVTVKK